MDWVVFGDDWGSHHSTTQHLIRSLPEGDAVIWINSLGMRAPRLGLADAMRLRGKAEAMLKSRLGVARRRENTMRDERPRMLVLSPQVLPLHLSRLARRYNARSIANAITRAMDQLDMHEPFVLSSTPVCVDYLDFPHRALAYLKLDEYREMDEVDAALIDATEGRMMSRADLVLVTAKALFPTPAAIQKKSVYLPQGVDVPHFARAETGAQRRKILGFYGLIDDRIDFDLVQKLAALCNDWKFEFIGRLRTSNHEVPKLPNLELAGPVAYAELPARIQHWGAAWIPYKLNKQTEAINPLKLREYLATGLPVLSTPLPESRSLEDVTIAQDASQAQNALEELYRTDTPLLRKARREKMEVHSWKERAARMRSLLEASQA